MAINRWEDWTRKLEVATFLRRGEVRLNQRMQAYLIRKKLEELEHELEHDPYPADEVRRVVESLEASHRRLEATHDVGRVILKRRGRVIAMEGGVVPESGSMAGLRKNQ